MLTIKPIQLDENKDAADLITLLTEYALDPMGGGEALPKPVQLNLVNALKQRSDYHGWIAYWHDKPAGLLNAFEGFSTFYAKPLLNIHDLAVIKQHRGKGIAQALMIQAEEFAIKNHYCKLTLEVLTGNGLAKRIYHKLGFAPYKLTDAAGFAEFWQKML